MAARGNVGDCPSKHQGFKGHKPVKQSFPHPIHMQGLREQMSDAAVDTCIFAGPTLPYLQTRGTRAWPRGQAERPVLEVRMLTPVDYLARSDRTFRLSVGLENIRCPECEFHSALLLDVPWVHVVSAHRQLLVACVGSNCQRRIFFGPGCDGPLRTPGDRVDVRPNGRGRERRNGLPRQHTGRDAGPARPCADGLLR